MSKPDITLQPSKGVVSEAAARIYAAYIAAGLVKDEETDTWIKRSIREAIIIAKTINASVESHDTLSIDESMFVRPNAAVSNSNRSKKKSQTKSKKLRTSTQKSRASKMSKPVEKNEVLEKLAEEVLLDDSGDWMTPAMRRCRSNWKRTPLDQ